MPFVRAIVPTVDLEGGRVVLTPPEGLLDLASGGVGAADQDAAPYAGPAGRTTAVASGAAEAEARVESVRVLR